MTEKLSEVILTFCRISAFISLTPGFSYKSIPKYQKVLLSIGLTISVVGYSSTNISLVIFPIFMLMVIKEVLIGLSMGYIVYLMFSCIEMAGQYIDFQVGFSMGMVLDPATGIYASHYAKLYNWLGLVILFTTDLHHLLIKSLFESFKILQVGDVNLTSYNVEGIVKLFIEVFKFSLLLAIPLMIVALLADVVLGIVSRSVPQINVLMLGMPLKILISFLFMLVFLPNLIDFIVKLLPNLDKYLKEFIYSLAG